MLCARRIRFARSESAARESGYIILLFRLRNTLQKSKSFGPKNLTTSLPLSSLNIFYTYFFFAVNWKYKIICWPVNNGFLTFSHLYFFFRRENKIQTSFRADILVKQNIEFVRNLDDEYRFTHLSTPVSSVYG